MTNTWGLHTGPATYIGMSGQLAMPCRIVRFRRDCVMVRFGDRPAELVHPDHLRQVTR
ncbi:hypothetical protein [Gordonia sp. NB41Y]|uniref:hypothetical protein n=1 Tax=Gordonia sp. NB41Y TaxID=875808 RepID=UPI00034AD0FD|nr:hypothetical protein [Gordonia sp. NB41Y]WLP89461.1 hypothetical protein Q9K23_18020 [Gordonia sp. NB41Y]